MSDDISMGALVRLDRQRARAAIAAGCDLVLHCNGELDEMRAVARRVPAAGRRGGGRADAALAGAAASRSADLAAMRAECDGAWQ